VFDLRLIVIGIYPFLERSSILHLSVVFNFLHGLYLAPLPPLRLLDLHRYLERNFYPLQALPMVRPQHLRR
jgi:hypothetical protein